MPIAPSIVVVDFHLIPTSFPPSCRANAGQTIDRDRCMECCGERIHRQASNVE